MNNYVKARYEGSKRSYCFATEEDLKPGDEAVTPNGTKSHSSRRASRSFMDRSLWKKQY